MADELDPRLEARLRTALRAEANGLPFTITSELLEERLATRRRARARRRVGVLAAAAAVVVGLGAIGLSLGRIPGPVAQTPPPLLPELATLPSYSELLAQADGNPTVLKETEGGSPNALGGTELADVTGQDTLLLMFACSTGNPNELELQVADSSGLMYFDAHLACGTGAQIRGFTNGPMAQATSVKATLFAPPGIAWRAILAVPDLPGSPVPPSGSSSLAADCVPVNDPATLPSLDLVDQTENVVSAGVVAYDQRSDGTVTNDPDSWVVPSDSPNVTLGDGLRFDAGRACVADWHIEAAPASQVEAALASGAMPYTQEYVVDPAPDGGHDVALRDLPAGDVLVRVKATWYSTSGAEAPVTSRVYRVTNVVADASPEPTPSGDPSLAPVLDGETPLTTFPVTAADRQVTESATVPAGTDWYDVTVDCRGDGSIALEVDGVGGTWPCGGIGRQTFTQDRTPGVIVKASVTGSARFLVRVGGVDLQKMAGVSFVPPTLAVTGRDAAGGSDAVSGFVGCGLSYEVNGATSVDDCGPSWQPVADALQLGPGATVSFRLGGGWSITGASADVAANTDILPSGQSPDSHAVPVIQHGSTWTFELPDAGDWGVRVSVGGEKDGARFGVPYYVRVIVAP